MATQVTITGKFVTGAAVNEAGTVTFRPTATMKDAAGHQIVSQAPVTTTLDGTGSIPAGFKLYANNDPTTTPLYVTYEITEKMTSPVARTRKWFAVIDFQAGTIDLSALADASSIPPVYGYAPSSIIPTLIPYSMGTTKGDMIVRTATTFDRYPAGGDHLVPIFDSTQPQGLRNGRPVPQGAGTIFHGDSTTAGPDVSGPRNVNQSQMSWCTVAAWASDRHVSMIRNSGVGGNTTAQMLGRIQPDVFAFYPSTLVLSGGLNDMGGATDETTIQTQVAGALANMAAMALTARALGIRVVLAPEWGKPFAGEKMRRLAEALKTLARQQGYYLYDVAEAVLDNTGTTDYILPVGSSRGGDQTHLDQAHTFKAAQGYIDFAERIDHRRSRRHFAVSDVSDKYNRLGGGCFTSGTVGGSGIPTNWAGAGNPTAGTITSTVEAPDLDDDFIGNCWRIVGTNYTGAKAFQRAYTITPGTDDVGDIWRIAFRLIAKGITGDASYSIGCIIAANPGVFAAYGLPISGWTIPHDGWVSTEDLILPTGITTATFYVQLPNCVNPSNIELSIAQMSFENVTKSGNIYAAEVV